jgi:prophage DNA circulation protein
MSFREQLRSASFRGVPFKVSGARSNFGRRVNTYEFPNRDRPYSQDMGRSAREFSVDAYLIGEDYLSQRDALLYECEKGGPGELVHPYYGSLSVLFKSARVRDRASDRRMCTVSLTFVEYNVLIEYPLETIDSISQVLSAREAAIQAVFETFQDIYQIANEPSYIVNSAMDTIDQFISQGETLRRSVQSIPDFQRTIQNIKNKGDAIVSLAGDIVNGIIDILTFGTNPENPDNPADENNAQNRFDELKEFFDFTPETGTPARTIANAVQTTAVIAASGVLTQIDFDSVRSSETTRDVVLTQIDKINKQEDVQNTIYNSLETLRAKVAQDIQIRKAELERISTFTPARTLPSLVIANYLFGGVEKESDIVNRNNIEHPGFIPGGREVEILVNVN